MDLTWRLFTNCTSQEAALKVAAQLFRQTNHAVGSLHAEPYHKGGFTVSACSSHVSQHWSEFVVLALATAQRVGRGWVLSGSITEEVDAWSNNAVIAGIQSIHIHAARPG